MAQTLAAAIRMCRSLPQALLPNRPSGRTPLRYERLKTQTWPRRFPAGWILPTVMRRLALPAFQPHRPAPTRPFVSRECDGDRCGHGSEFV